MPTVPILPCGQRLEGLNRPLAPNKPLFKLSAGGHLRAYTSSGVRSALYGVDQAPAFTPFAYPYVSLGPRPRTVRPPFRHEGAEGPTTVIAVTTPAPSSWSNRRIRSELIKRSCVAQAVESHRTRMVVW